KSRSGARPGGGPAGAFQLGQAARKFLYALAVGVVVGALGRQPLVFALDLLALQLEEDVGQDGPGGLLLHRLVVAARPRALIQGRVWGTAGGLEQHGGRGDAPRLDRPDQLVDGGHLGQVEQRALLDRQRERQGRRRHEQAQQLVRQGGDGLAGGARRLGR